MLLRAALVALLFSSNALAAANDCDRACLRTTLDQYLTAVTKHDPTAAPLFIGFRQTENATVVKLGTGVWKSVTALGKVQRRYLDAVSGQAGYFGIVEEGATPAIVGLRVKVENKKITEAEWIIARKGDPGLNGPAGGNVFDIDNLIANPPSDKPLAKEARMPREAMMAIVNSYFDGITTHDGSIIMAIQGCSRLENGQTMTGRAGRGGAGVPSDCTSGLETINIANVAGRRYPIIDEELGVAMALATFIRKPGTATRRNMFSEWFILDNYKIKNIYAAMYYPPPDAPVPNWPPFEGNWPLPAAFTLAPAR